MEGERELVSDRINGGKYRTTELAFVLAALAVFYLLVYGLPVTGTALPLVRSVALVVYAVAFIRLQDRLVPFPLTLVERRLNVPAVAGWGVVCFLVNLVVVGGTFYLLARGFAERANHGFDIQRFSSKPIPLKVFMAFAAALSEEVVYRRVLFRYLLSLRPPGRAGFGAALTISSLVFGFGHFHAGLEKCLITSVSGLVFAVCYAWRRDIRVVVTGHFLGDAFAVIV